MPDIKFEIINKIGILSEAPSGWSQTAQPRQLERPRPKIRPARMVTGWRENGQRPHPLQRRIARPERIIE
jgi:hypothetical protein